MRCCLRTGVAARSAAASTPATELTGPDFHLTIDELPVNFTGAARRAVAVNGQVPAPLLRMRQGDTVTIRVTNNLRERTSIHWHGFILPADMDGVPGLSFDGIAPGDHVHLSLQGEPVRHVLVPLAFALPGTDRAVRPHRRRAPRAANATPPTASTRCCCPTGPITIRKHIYATLKRQSDYYNFGKRTVADFLADVREKGFAATAADRRMWGAMRMNPTDLADVTRLCLHLSIERQRAGGELDRRCSSPASACGCASSTARR